MSSQNVQDCQHTGAEKVIKIGGKPNAGRLISGTPDKKQRWINLNFL